MYIVLYIYFKTYNIYNIYIIYYHSYLLAWTSFLASAAASLIFLMASRKRKLLDSDNINFTHQKLDISVTQQ